MAFPAVVTIASNQEASNTTTHTPTLPASLVNGNLLIVWGSIDASPVVTLNAGSAAGWTLFGYRAQNTATVTGCWAWKIVNGTDQVSFDTDTSEQSSWLSWQISGAGTPSSPTTANWAVGNSTNSDPPNWDDGVAAADNLWIAVCARDAQVANTGYPTNYTQNQRNVTATNAGGATSGAAERQLNAQGENPGAFTSGAEQWVACTIKVPPGGATAYTIAANGGSYAITGTAASLEFGREVAADGGSIAITGTAASLERGFEVAADGGSYAVTGTAASLEHGYEVAADGGSYAITGSVATLRRNLPIAAVGGSYALSGTAASLEHGYEVAADGGSYAVTGTAASLEHGYEVAADGGSYTITGSAVTFERTYILDALGGSIAISGTAASLEHGYEVAADPGSYLISGTSAGLIYGVAGAYTISADSGSYTISGTSASLEHGWEVAADGGSIAITGSDASLEFGYEVAADGGSYEITGSDVTLTYGDIAAGGTSSAWKRYAAYRKDHPQSAPVQRKPLLPEDDIPPEIVELVAEPDPEPIEPARVEPEPASPTAAVTVPDINEALYEPIPLPRKKKPKAPPGFDPVELDNDFILMAARMRR